MHNVSQWVSECVCQHLVSTLQTTVCIKRVFSYVYLVWHPKSWLKFGSFAYSRWPLIWPIYTSNSIICCLQPTVFIVLVSNYHICLYLISSCKYVNFAHLHIQYGCQNGGFMPRKAYFVSAVHYFHCMDIECSYISPLDLSSLKYAKFLICIINMAAKMGEICSEQHICIYAAHNLYSTGL